MKQCTDCFIDISHRSNAAKRCVECQKEQRRKLARDRDKGVYAIKADDLLGPAHPIYDTLHPCPVCGRLTANRYKCSVCWDDAIYNSNEGMI